MRRQWCRSRSHPTEHQTIVSTALPTIVDDLGGLNKLSWVVTAYLLAFTASTPLFCRAMCSPHAMVLPYKQRSRSEHCMQRGR